VRDLKELQKELKLYNGNDITVRADGSLRFCIPIHKVQAIVTNKVVLISNTDLVRNEEIEICTDDINDIEIDTEIVLQMNGNYNLYIST